MRTIESVDMERITNVVDSPRERLIENHEKIVSHNYIRTFVEAVHSIILIMNEKREVLYANSFAAKALGERSIAEMIGKRPGDIFECVHSRDSVRGCGFSNACPSCSALKIFIRAIEASVEVTDTADLLINTGNQKVFRDLEIKMTPFMFEDERLFILSVIDNTNLNLLNDLEQTFFHDVINKVSALRGYMHLIYEENQMMYKDDYQFLEIVLEDLLDIIKTQRKLVDLSGGKQVLHISDLKIHGLLDYLVHFFRLVNERYADKLIMDDVFEDICFSSDEVLVKRVLINIVKNALEGSSVGQKVKIGARKLDADTFEISVNNKKQIPNEILENLFSEIVSTKNGEYHGWGTKSMKLIGEEYLKGAIEIMADAETGTTVKVKLPYRLEVST